MLLILSLPLIKIIVTTSQLTVDFPIKIIFSLKRKRTFLSEVFHGCDLAPTPCPIYTEDMC